MNMKVMRLLLALLTSACAAGGASDMQSTRNKKSNQIALPLQLQEKYTSTVKHKQR